MGKNIFEGKEKDLLNAIVDNRYVGMTILDKDGIILFRNKVMEEASGFRNEDVKNKHISVIPGTDEVLEVLETGIPKLAHIYQSKIGKNAVIHRIPLFDNDNCIIGAMVIVLFKDAMEMHDILYRYNLAENKLKYYERELKKFQSAKYNLDNIIGKSEKTIYLKNTIMKCAKTNSAILVTGETGTGKELCSHAIHLNTEKENGPFIRVNCASVPEDLFESELFGYEPGAFTDADKSGKPGKFELANHGTRFAGRNIMFAVSNATKIAESSPGTRNRKVRRKQNYRVRFQIDLIN